MTRTSGVPKWNSCLVMAQRKKKPLMKNTVKPPVRDTKPIRCTCGTLMSCMKPIPMMIYLRVCPKMGCCFPMKKRNVGGCRHCRSVSNVKDPIGIKDHYKAPHIPFYHKTHKKSTETLYIFHCQQQAFPIAFQRKKMYNKRVMVCCYKKGAIYVKTAEHN